MKEGSSIDNNKRRRTNWIIAIILIISLSIVSPLLYYHYQPLNQPLDFRIKIASEISRDSNISINCSITNRGFSNITIYNPIETYTYHLITSNHTYIGPERLAMVPHSINLESGESIQWLFNLSLNELGLTYQKWPIDTYKLSINCDPDSKLSSIQSNTIEFSF
jgi:hypothetical protein